MRRTNRNILQIKLRRAYSRALNFFSSNFAAGRWLKKEKLVCQGPKQTSSASSITWKIHRRRPLVRPGAEKVFSVVAAAEQQAIIINAVAIAGSTELTIIEL